MALNRIGKKLSKKNRQTKRGLDYQRFEERKMLAADLAGFAKATAVPSKAPSVLEQLASRDDVAWAQKGLNQLIEVASESNDLGTTTVFQQSWNGLAVYDSWITVVQDADGQITNVNDQARQNIRGYATDGSMINENLATRIGSQDLGKAASVESSASMAWYYAGNKARLSWLVETTVFDTDGEVFGEHETWISVFDGSIFNREVTGSAVSELLNAPISETGVFARIVINDAIGASGSRTYAEPFDSVVSISVGCTGTLISSNTVISARHCGIGSGDTISFGDNSNNPDATFTVASASQPAGGNANSALLDGGDVSILTLTTDVPTSIATPMRFIDATSDLVGMTAVTVGYGYNGVGSSGHGFTADGTRWGGENVIDAFGSPSSSSGSNIISTDFDSGSAGNNTIGGSNSTPLTFEATTAPGDSGGPVLVDVGGEWVIAGVLSGGTTSTSVYGDISWWTGTAVYRSQIESAGGTFVGDGAGSVSFDQDGYFVGDSAVATVRDGNAVGDVSVVITTTSGDSETLTISASSVGVYPTSIDTAQGSASQNDGILQVEEGDEISITYVDVDDGDGNTVDRTDSATINEIGPVGLIGVDFDDAANAPLNWLSLSGGTGTFQDLNNEQGGASQVDLQIIGASTGYEVNLIASTIPQHANSIANIDGQIYTGADPIEFVYSDLSPSTDYEVYVMAAEGFYDSIQQTVSIQGEGSPITFEQRFDQGELFVNDQVGSSSSTLAEFAIVVTSDANGTISINVDPIGATQDVVVAGLAIFEVAEPPTAPTISLNAAEVERSMLTDAVITFDEVLDFGANAFELVKRGPDGGDVEVTSSVDNSSGYSVVTLAFSGEFTETSGSLVDGNYQLTIVGDEITSAAGVAVDGDGDGDAGGNLVFGDNESDNFFRFFGDIDGDRDSDVFDLLQLRQAWNTSAGDTGFNEGFDFNVDGEIDIFDLLPFRQNYRDALEFV
ncbi:trypsin-like serine protease [Mariniblastus fucicola]|uniref:Trypsin n=1 Tax=Mariniblastus fucicola TaxID=980251 RepID=A0A5B9P6Y8_9BACT|nr:trypsin-like serine protease [Mariniblastus fucicola]QEG20772.1 Trypsin [Mariniblastus fucicola]